MNTKNKKQTLEREETICYSLTLNVLLNFILQLTHTSLKWYCCSNITIHARWIIISDPPTSNHRTDTGQNGSSLLKSDALLATPLNKFTPVKYLEHCLLHSKNFINTKYRYYCFVIITTKYLYLLVHVCKWLLMSRDLIIHIGFGIPHL